MSHAATLQTERSVHAAWAFTRIGLIAASAVWCFGAAPVSGQESKENTEWRYPAAVRTWEIEGGYRVPVHNNTADTTYYRVGYKGSLIDSKGTPLQPSQHFEITEPKAQAPGGDRSSLELLFTKGSATAGGELIEMNGAMPFPLRGLEALQLRGAGYVGTDIESESLKVAVGLESRPFRVPGLGQRTGASNWLVLGLMGERAEKTDATVGDSTYGLVTGRLFIGKAFGWRETASVEDTAKPIEAAILAKAPDYATAEKLAAELVKMSSVTQLQQDIIDAVGELNVPGNPRPTDAQWVAKVKELVAGAADALNDQPTFAVYMEATGWNAFSPQEGVPRRRGLMTLTADYWPLPTRDDVILRARYEWGFQRAQPDTRVNQFLITVTLQL